MINIGEKIKKLRKEKRLTLAKVAGDGLSVGMLSLIENGKAQPSMESLQHIAKQLGINVSELMQNGHAEEMRSLLNEMEKINTKLRYEFNEQRMTELLQQLWDTIDPYIQAGKLSGQSYEEVRLLEIYTNAQNYLKQDVQVDIYFDLIKKYEQLHAYSKIINTFLRLSSFTFNKRNYRGALDYILQGKDYLEKYGDLINEIEKLDFYYHLTVLYAALNEKENAEHYLNVALAISKEKKIIYRLNDFYRYLFVQYCAEENEEKASYYLNKIRALSGVLEDPVDLFYVQFLQLIYTNSIEKNYVKALDITIPYHEELGEDFYNGGIEHFVNAEYAYAYYHLGKFSEAIKILADFKIPKYTNHPLDLARFYRTFAIKALSYAALGDFENAKREVLYAVDGVKDYEDLADKRFILEAYDKIMHNG